MGADQVENTIICPYCCKRIKCEGFQEIVNLNNTGGHVQHLEHTNHVGKADRSIRTPQDNFILHNPKHMKMVSADLLTQLDPKKIPCPRCRAKINEAQKLLNKGICIDPTNVARICDHCFLKSQTQTNKKYSHNFLIAHGEQDEYSKKYNKHWLTNMENELSKAISEFRTQKKPRRTYSDIDIDLLNRDAPGPVIKCTVQEMFHSDVNLLETNRPQQVQSLKKQVLAVERAVNFTEKIETFQTLGSESSIQINVEKQDYIDVYNEYYRLGPHPSIEKEKYHHTPAESLQYEEITKPKIKAEEMQRAYEKLIPSQTEKIIDYARLGPRPSIEGEKYHHAPAESLQYEETIKQKKKGEEMEKAYEKSIQSRTEKIIDYDLEEKTSFFFPESFQKPDTKLKRRVSSSDLIKDTQEKIRLKAKEEEEKLIEKLKLKAELKEKKKRDREEKEKLAREEKERLAREIKEKLAREEKEKLAREEKEKLAREEKEKLTREENERLIKEKSNVNEEGIIKTKSSDKTSKMDTTDILEQKGKMKKGGVEEELEQKRESNKSKEDEKLASEAKKGKIKKDAFKEESAEKRETTQSKAKLASLEQKGKLKKGEFEEEPDKKREATQPKGKDTSTSLEQKGKLKKSEFEEKPGEKRETTQSKGKDKSDVLEQNNKLKKGAFAEASKEGQDTTHTKKQDMIDEKNKMKLGGLKKEPEEKQTTLQSKERDKSSELKKTEGLKERELKLAEVKLQKQSIDKLGSQLAKVKKNENEKEHSAMQSKKQDELNKLIESSKKRSSKEDGVEEKRNATQTKLEKGNKTEALQEKDLKMTHVKLVKASADDLGQLAKVNKNIPGTLSKSKEPEISKMLLESAKRKEALVDKAPRFEAPKKKDDKSAMVDTKETKERELKMNQVKIAEPSIDNVILKLIRIRSGKKLNTVDDRSSAKSKSVKRSARGKKKKVGEDEYNLIEEESSIEYKNREEITQPKKRKGSLEFQPPHRDGQDIIPIYITHKLSEISSSAPLKNVDDAILAVEDGKKVDPETSKGVIRYALSDRTFIEKGWTMLPVEKVVRKMNIYRMRPAQPEFDWFEHNKHKGLMLYDTGTKLAEFDKNGRGRWFYQNGRLALDYYEAEETNTQQRFVVYSNGEQDERGRSRPVTILATFDHLGNGVVFDHAGKIRLKYNQTEGVLLDRSIGPSTNWKWHTLNDPPVLQQVMIDTQMPLKDPKILKMGGPADNRTRPDNEEMLAIEFDNFIKEKSKKLTQKFKPFQIRMKALKINENFSLKVLDQATIYLIFRDGSANLKVNIGMILDHKEIVDTDTAELGEVSNSLERLPARTDSLAALQSSVANARRFERIRTERERRLRHPEPCLSADELGKAASRPLKPPLRTLPTSPKGSIEQCKCSRKQSSNLYYSTQLL